MIDPDDSIASDEPDSVTVITEVPTSDGDAGVLNQQEDQREQEAVMAQLEDEVGDAIYEATEVVQVSLLDGGGAEEEGAVYDDVEYYEDQQQPSQREDENGEGDGIQIPVAEDDVLAADGIYQTEYAQAEEAGNGEGDVAIEGEYTTEYIQDGGGEAFEGDGLNYPDGEEQNGEGEYPEEERYDESGAALDSANGMEVDEYGEYSGSDHQQMEASADEFARGEKRKSPLTLAEGVSSEDQLGDDELQKGKGWNRF
ncbi:hypothetical protein BDR26DRAFT_869686 [Obelidium mucronatum]|nr:hypothetical protein BDR26DRAFT_869686 [Obelidium mucronatum]